MLFPESRHDTASSVERVRCAPTPRLPREMRAGDGSINALSGELSDRAQMNHATFPLDVKSLSNAGLIEGLAAGYGNLDAHGGMFAPKAFAKSIERAKTRGRQPAMLLYHDLHRPVGRWDSFRETPAGLLATGQIAITTSNGREAYELLTAGALAGLSVGFNALHDTRDKNGRRVITEADLFEVSLVAVPSNPLTYITSVRQVEDVRGLEELLREAGVSGRKAKVGAAAAWRAIQTTKDNPDAALASILNDASRSLARFKRNA